MGINQLVAQISLEELNKLKSDGSLFDAIVQRDKPLIVYLVNNRYKLEITNRGFIKEPMNINKIISYLEVVMSENKRIKVIA